MINIDMISRVMVAQYKVDFRKGFDGLLAEAYKMGLDPLSGDLIFFFGRRSNMVKILFCDETGIWVLNKRFYTSKRRGFKFLDCPEYAETDRATLSLLMQGKGWKIDQSNGRSKAEIEKHLAFR